MSDWIERNQRDRASYSRELAIGAAGEPGWRSYVEFCQLRELGLRSDALAKLEFFIAEMEKAPFDERRRFVSWLMHRMAAAAALFIKLCPHPLKLRVVDPTLMEWTEVEPMSSEPHRWIGDLEHLRIAVEIDPDDSIAKRMLVVKILKYIGFNTHEISSGYGYMGDTDEGFAALDAAEVLVTQLPSPDDREKFLPRINEERSLINEYLARR